ncbi:sugar phosphate nucleotidyltransferase [Salmonella enterica subsp. enterica serovar Anatum]|nr:sugar phosphate nucleotidyltransferase [Salmonella enterica subsp. enterica serovar Anatum]
MVSLEKNDRVMLARQLPLKSVALILAGGRGTRLKDLTNKRATQEVVKNNELLDSQRA